MNLEHFKRKLEAKERELLAQVSRLGEQAQATGTEEVRDATDDATVAEGTSEAISEEALASQTLTEVRDALQRIAEGTYGKCAACGRPIETARLEAVPWARYCLQDQEKQEKASHAPQGGSTL